MLHDLGEAPVSEVVPIPELALVLEAVASCLLVRIDSPPVWDVGFLDKVVIDKSCDGEFAEGSRSMGPHGGQLFFDFGLLGCVIVGWAAALDNMSVPAVPSFSRGPSPGCKP